MKCSLTSVPDTCDLGIRTGSLHCVAWRLCKDWLLFSCPILCFQRLWGWWSTGLGKDSHFLKWLTFVLFPQETPENKLHILNRCFEMWTADATSFTKKKDYCTKKVNLSSNNIKWRNYFPTDAVSQLLFLCNLVKAAGHFVVSAWKKTTSLHLIPSFLIVRWSVS